MKVKYVVITVRGKEDAERLCVCVWGGGLYVCTHTGTRRRERRMESVLPVGNQSQIALDVPVRIDSILFSLGLNVICLNCKRF